MPVLFKNASISPFMSESKSLSLGLNPLGMRTASEQLFTALLPGMNVVTLRVRYYSFYCWLLRNFYKKSKTETNIYEFRRHIRASELLMALIHAQHNKGLGIPGITFATEMVTSDSDTFDILSGAMPDNKPSGGYWKGALGALGTYYVASLQEMGLIAPLVQDSRLYNITKGSESDHITGMQLAEAFEENIGDECSSLFMTCVQKGEVTRKELFTLGNKFISQEMKESRERQLLTEMLLQKDKPSSVWESYLRKETLLLLLNYLKNNEVKALSELEFSRYVYEQYQKQIVNSAAAVGWYAYYLNDSRQFESLRIFSELLVTLHKSKKPGQWENINEITTIIADDVCQEMGVTTQTLGEVLEKWPDMKRPDKTMAMAFFQILDDYVQNHTYHANKEQMHKLFHGVRNDAMDSFERLEGLLTKPFRDYIKLYLTDDIIYNHYSEAMRKYSQNGVPTQKLAIENGYVRWLDYYEATHSSPRLNTLFNFVIDLGLVVNTKLTDKGYALIERIEK